MESFTGIIETLTRQRDAIQNALDALRGLTTDPAPASSPAKRKYTRRTTATAAPSGRKPISNEARERMRIGQQRRYANLHKTPVPATVAVKKTGGMTDAGRERLAENLDPVAPPIGEDEQMSDPVRAFDLAFRDAEHEGDHQSDGFALGGVAIATGGCLDGAKWSIRLGRSDRRYLELEVGLRRR